MRHLTTDELVALDHGRLPDDRLDHLLECDACAAHLDHVALALSDLPTPAMPPEVAARLDAVVAAESNRRESGRAAAEAAAAAAAHAKRLTLGTFGDNSPHRAAPAKTTSPQRDRERLDR